MRPRKPKTTPKRCPVCGTPLPPVRRTDRLYCSVQCKTQAYWARRIEKAA